MAFKKDIIKELILSKQEISVNEICIEADCSSLYCNTILKSLEEDGKVEKNGKMWKSISDNISKEKTIDMSEVLAIDEKFNYLHNLVRMVIQNINPSLLITGMSGIGKTFSVSEELKKNNLREGRDYIVIKGHSSALGLYTLLYHNADKLIIFDDCDSVFGDNTSLNILKTALDSYNERTISWSSRTLSNGEVPQSFTFSGRIIFISNYSMNKIDKAILSRTFSIDISMKPFELLDYLDKIKYNIEPGIMIDLKDEVLNYLKSIANQFESLNIRTFIKAIRIRVGVDSSCDWKKMIYNTLK